MDPSGSAYLDDAGYVIILGARPADGGLPPRVRDLAPTNPDYPLYLRVLKDLKPGETRRLPSLADLDAAVSAIRPPPVGTATMDGEGTITLRLRSVSQGMVAETVRTLAPQDPEYAATIEHLGGIKPGESRVIPAYPNAP